MVWVCHRLYIHIRIHERELFEAGVTFEMFPVWKRTLD